MIKFRTGGIIYRKYKAPAQSWYKASDIVPDDARDVLAVVVKPVIVQQGTPPQMRAVMCVVCYESGHWYDEPNPRANVLLWTEIPKVWKDLKQFYTITDV